jgi:hypothetical protein
MTLVKMGLMGAALAGGLVGGAGNAKADVRFGIGPARVVVQAPVARVTPVRYGRYDSRHRWGRPIVVSPAPVYGYGGTYVSAPAPRGENPSYVASEIRNQVSQLDNDIRYHVQSGSIRPEALAQLDADRQEIERDLAEASAKGYITAADRQHLEEHVQEIRDLRERFRCNEGNAYGQVSYYR